MRRLTCWMRGHGFRGPNLWGRLCYRCGAFRDGPVQP